MADLPLILLGLVVTGVVGWVVMNIRSIARKEVIDEITTAAAEEALEMHREATEAEKQAAGMTDDEARKEAMRWARK